MTTVFIGPVEKHTTDPMEISDEEYLSTPPSIASFTPIPSPHPLLPS